jgi:hypothetical protein
MAFVSPTNTVLSHEVHWPTPGRARKLSRFRHRDDPPFQPSTLFLTWQRDPTTTRTVQWVGTAGETADTRVWYSPAAFDRWQAHPTAARA